MLRGTIVGGSVLLNTDGSGLPVVATDAPPAPDGFEARCSWVASADAVAQATVAVNTVPADAVARYASTLAAVPRLLDSIYDPWPTPLAAAVEKAGGEAISGLQMLLNQAFTQVEQFTGMPAPREAMRAALQ